MMADQGLLVNSSVELTYLGQYGIFGVLVVPSASAKQGEVAIPLFVFCPLGRQ